jgi:hypothetical protein
LTEKEKSPTVGKLVAYLCTDKKENQIQISIIYKENQNGAVAMSYMRKGFLIYEEMGKYLTKYEEALLVIYDFATAPF